MSTSNTLTKNDLKKVLEKLSISTGGEGALNDMTAQEIEEFLNEIEADGPNFVDYVVEQGTSGIWTYRKWNSGIAECWGSWSGTVSHYASVGTFYGYVTSAVSFPTNLFITRPIAKYNCIVGSGFAWPGTNMAITNTSMSMYAVATTSGSQNCQFDIQVIGKWK